MNIPLSLRLRKQLHKDIAMLQDEVVDIVYSIAQTAVLHGGTAIWRCYRGNRFSEDLDFYLASASGFRESFGKKLASRGLTLSKYRTTRNTIFAKVSNGRTEISLELALKTIKRYVAKQYEKADGTYMDIFTLSLGDLILEKATAYTSRRLIRDIYDVYFLSSHLSDNKEILEIKHKMQRLLKEIEKAPVDEKNLKAIVYSGAVPSFNEMVSAVKRRFSK